MRRLVVSGPCCQSPIFSQSKKVLAMPVTDQELEMLSPGGSEQEQITEDGPRLISNPVTGEIVDLNDIDASLGFYDELRSQLDELNTLSSSLREHIWSLTQGTTKTRRLESDHFIAKCEEGSPYISQKILKEAWNEYPQHRDRLLSIASLSVKKAELKKLVATTATDESFMNFITMVASAIDNESKGMPRVSITRKEE